MFTKSYYSLKYGILSPEELIQWAKEANYERAVLVDINTTTAALGFVRSAQEQKIAPIVGVEIRNGIDHCYTILAKNNRGFHEANQFLSVHLHEQKNFPERPPHLGNCIVLYPQGNQPKKLSENEWIGVQSSEKASSMANISIHLGTAFATCAVPKPHWPDGTIDTTLKLAFIA